MGDRTAETWEHEWRCGRCGFIVAYQEEEPSVCPNCDYIHGQQDWKDVPDSVKIRIQKSI